MPERERDRRGNDGVTEAIPREQSAEQGAAERNFLRDHHAERKEKENVLSEVIGGSKLERLVDERLADDRRRDRAHWRRPERRSPLRRLPRSRLRGGSRLGADRS